jgi:hypothetical protein
MRQDECEALARRVAELTREREEAIAVATAERDRIALLIQQCDHLALEIFALRKRHAREQSRQLAYALATIRNMERSWFWRMRMVSVRIRSLLPWSGT